VVRSPPIYKCVWKPSCPCACVSYSVSVVPFTRLPIGAGSGGTALRKEARIPEPWRLQVELPRPPCRAYFLRMDVTRHTTLEAIRLA
jgi:hypothetical protein